jgi:hypothetical protein
MNKIGSYLSLTGIIDTRLGLVLPASVLCMLPDRGFLSVVFANEHHLASEATGVLTTFLVGLFRERTVSVCIRTCHFNHPAKLRLIPHS